MPFPESWIESRLASAARDGRMAHAYLLTGRSLERLESLFHRIASTLLGDTNPSHPDLHIVRPESKTRRLTIEQIRDLEHELQLKAHHAPHKVAAILSADRMCVGRAEAANAFLKTLEEPPDHCVIFLTTDRPELLLPTIRSRCLTLPLDSGEGDGDDPVADADTSWPGRWFDIRSTGPRAAYERSALLLNHLQLLREHAAAAVKQRFGPVDKDSEDVFNAQVEGEFSLLRDLSVGKLTRSIWLHSSGQPGMLTVAARSCLALEELRSALLRGVEQGLAIERACLLMEGVIEPADSL